MECVNSQCEFCEDRWFTGLRDVFYWSKEKSITKLLFLTEAVLQSKLVNVLIQTSQLISFAHIENRKK